ncbi:MAG: hypothetical protein DRI39_02640 [Chloroflexi bacterium]|nr:MAG: hypothetical protein DRI39_02640 [Chloroflexota bacterium]
MAEVSSTAANPSLEEFVLTCLREQGGLDVANLEVRVRHHIAYLEGSVPNLRQKRLAGETAAQVEGIRGVVNRLRIAPSPLVDDESLKRRVIRALARNPKLEAGKVSADVINGVVHLGGFVSTAAEKRLAEEEVWAAPGVRHVINRIDVLSQEIKSELQIAGQILQGLSQCLGLDLSKVTVEVVDGTAHLKGVVPNDYLRSAAEELTRWTPSIGEVVNELQVLAWPGTRSDLQPERARPSSQGCRLDTETLCTQSALASQSQGPAPEWRGDTVASKATRQ